MIPQAATNTGARMETLFLCGDERTVAAFSPLLQSAGTEMHVCSDPDLAVEMLAHWRFDAVIIDCDGVSKGLDVLRVLREAPSNRTAVAFALVATTTATTAFQMGASFVLNKPIVRDRARSALRAAYGLMLLGRRRYYRRPIVLPATFRHSNGQESQLSTINVSEGGAGLQSASLLAVGERGRFAFELPDMRGPIEAEVEVVWSQEGRCGVRFVHIANSTLHSLRNWIRESFEQESNRTGRETAFLC
jgi:CheY-like chemotaxis protein